MRFREALSRVPRSVPWSAPQPEERRAAPGPREFTRPLWIYDGTGRPFEAPLDPILLLARHRALIARIRLAVGDARIFQERILPMMLSWAAAVQGLPRAAEGLFSETDGLFTAGLSVALRALERLDGRIYGEDWNPIERARMETRMRTAVFAAAILSEAKPLARVRLRAGELDPVDGRFRETARFEPEIETLLDFSLAHAGALFDASWRSSGEEPLRAGRGAALGVRLLGRLLAPETEAWMREAPEILRALFAAAAGASGETPEEGLILDAVVHAKRRVYAERRRETARADAARPLLAGWAGIFDLALRVLVRRGAVRVNPKPGSAHPDQRARLYWAADGVYLVWPEGWHAVLEAARLDWRLADAPDDVELAAHLLVAEGSAVPDPHGDPLHRIEPEGSEPVEAVMLADAETILALAQHRAALEERTVKMLGRPIRSSARRQPEAEDERPEEDPRRTSGEPRAESAVRLLWEAALPPRLPPFAAAALEAALRSVNALARPESMAMREGLFLPLELFPTGFAPVLLREGAAFGLFARTGVVRTRSADAEEQAESAPGLILAPALVRPVGVWPDGKTVDLPWPAANRTTTNL